MQALFYSIIILELFVLILVIVGGTNVLKLALFTHAGLLRGLDPKKVSEHIKKMR